MRKILLALPLIAAVGVLSVAYDHTATTHADQATIRGINQVATVEPTTTPEPTATPEPVTNTPTEPQTPGVTEAVPTTEDVPPAPTVTPTPSPSVNPRATQPTGGDIWQPADLGSGRAGN